LQQDFAGVSGGYSAVVGCLAVGQSGMTPSRRPVPIALGLIRHRLPAIVIGAILVLGGNRAATANDLASSDASPSAPFVVYCHDSDRDVVDRVLASLCHGEVVTEDEAKAIRERRSQYIAHVLHFDQRSGPEGMELARIGTAFFVDETARLLTNNHIVDECKAVTVGVRGQKPLAATVLATDVKNDLALLGVAGEAHAVAVFDSGESAGAFAAIVGYPDQGLTPLEPVVSAGTLLRGNNDMTVDGNIFFKADVRRGNSGGPIFDSHGSVIGIVKAKVDTVRTYRATNREIDDTGVGIALSVVLDFLRRNNALYRVEKRDIAIGPDQILAEADSFVVRAECWK